MTWRLLAGGAWHGRWIDPPDDWRLTIHVQALSGEGPVATYETTEAFGDLVLVCRDALPDPDEVAALLRRGHDAEGAGSAWAPPAPV